MVGVMVVSYVASIKYNTKHMGIAKEMYSDKLQQKDDEKLAAILGITYDELIQTEWHQEADEDDEGNCYGFVVYFEDSSPKHILKKIRNLNKDNQVWYSISDLFIEENLAFQEQLEAIIANKFFYQSFQNEISNVRQLNEINLDNQGLQAILKRQLFVTIIGSLETFLSETFINVTCESSHFFKNFIESYPNFKERKFQLNDIYKEYEKLQLTAKKEMLEVIYHNLPKVRHMYESTFEIIFPAISKLSKAVNTRHDLVHRNGKTKDGVIIIISKEMVSDLLDQVSLFVEDISISLNLKA